MRRTVPVLTMLVALAAACRENKAIAAARGNSVEYALAACECEKLQKKKPPGDTKLCGEQMARAERYMRINFEMGKVSAADRASVRKAGAEAFEKCMKEP